MNFWDKFVKTLTNLPWKPIVLVCSASFLLASIISFVAASAILKHMVVDGGTARTKAIPQQPAPSFGDKIDSAKATPLTAEALTLILRRNIFNSEGKLGEDEDFIESDTPSVPGGDFVETDLPIRVVGLIYGGTPYNGLATIENTSQRGAINSFVVGETIMRDARLVEIHQHRIILDRGGRLEYAELEEFKLQRSTRTKAKARPQATGVTPIAEGPPPERFSEPGLERDGTIIRITEDYKRDILANHLPKTLQDAKAMPHTDDTGQIQGWMLTRIREDSIYQKAGFQNGDIVEEINGVPMRDAGAAISFLNQLRSERSVEVRVRRGGSVMTFTIDTQ